MIIVEISSQKIQNYNNIHMFQKKKWKDEVTDQNCGFDCIGLELYLKILNKYLAFRDKS